MQGARSTRGRPAAGPSTAVPSSWTLRKVLPAPHNGLARGERLRGCRDVILAEGCQGQPRRACHPCRCPSSRRPRPMSPSPCLLLVPSATPPRTLRAPAGQGSLTSQTSLHSPGTSRPKTHCPLRRLCVACSPRREAVFSLTCDVDRLLHAWLHF